MADNDSDAAKASGADAPAAAAAADVDTASASAGTAAHVDVGADPARPRPAGDDDDDDETNGSVGLVRLFRFATPFDSFVLLIGTISAIAGGAVNAAFAILLGRVMGREWPSRRLRFPA